MRGGGGGILALYDDVIWSSYVKRLVTLVSSWQVTVALLRMRISALLPVQVRPPLCTTGWPRLMSTNGIVTPFGLYGLYVTNVIIMPFIVRAIQLYCCGEVLGQCTDTAMHRCITIERPTEMASIKASSHIGVETKSLQQE